MMDRIEDAVLRINPDLWLGGLMLCTLAPWFGRLV